MANNERNKARSSVRHNPYARPSSKTFLHKVTDSVKDFFTPSWLSSLVTTVKEPEREKTEHDQIAGGSAGLNSVPPAPSMIISSSAPTGLYHPQTGLQSQQYSTPHETTLSQHQSLQQTYQPSLSSNHTLSTNFQTHTVQYNTTQQVNNTVIEAGPGPGFFPTPGRSSTRINLPPTAEHSLVTHPRPGKAGKRARVDTDYHETSSLNISAFASSFNESVNGSLLNTSDLSKSSFYPGKTVYGGISSKRSFSLPRASPYKMIDSNSSSNKRNTTLTADNRSPPGSSRSRAASKILASLNKPTNLKRDLTKHSVQYFKKKTTPYTPPLKTISRNVEPAVKREVRYSILTRSQNKHGSQSQVEVKPRVASSEPGFFSFKSQTKTSTQNTQDTAYQFTAPVTVASPTPKTGPENVDFSFSNPTDVKKNEIKSNLTNDITGTSTAGWAKSPALQSHWNGSTQPKSSAPKATTSIWGSSTQTNNWSCSDCLVSNTADKNECLACGGKKPETKKAEKPAAENEKISSSWGSLGQVAADSWTCSTCMISNGDEKNACVACGTQKPASKPEVDKVKPANDLWGSFAKTSAGKWSCSTCMISNDADKSKCVACDTTKPVEKKKDETPVVASSWGNLIKGNEGKWSCTTCMISNDSDKENCVACQTSKPATSSTVSEPPKVTSSWGSFGQAAAGSWNCPTCMISNTSENEQCIACQTPKSAFKSSNAPSKEAPKVASSWGDLMKAQTDHWSCSMCLVTNPPNKKKCVACEMERPGESSCPIDKPAEVAINWGSLMQQSEGKWTCDVCTIQNDSDETSCVACQTGKPGRKAAQTPVFSGFSMQTTTAKSLPSWKCDTCLVTNPGDVSLCKCCSACKPGTQSSLGDLSHGKKIPLFGIDTGNRETKEEKPSSGGFKAPAGGIMFAAPATTTDTTKTSSNPSGGFKLNTPIKFPGAPVSSSSNDSQSSAPVGAFKAPNFTFQVPAATKSADSKISEPSKLVEKPKETITGEYKFSVFGTQAVSSASEGKGGSETEVPAPIFGSKETTNSLTTSSVTVEPVKPVINFGESGTDDKSKASEPAKCQFSFGSTSSNDKPAETADKAPVFSFGSKPPASLAPNTDFTAKPVFSFGSKPEASTTSNADEPPKKASFAFSAKPTEDKTADVSKPTFNFGSKPTESQPAAAPVFAFGISQPAESTEPMFGARSLSTRAAANEPIFSFGSAGKSDTSAKSLFGASSIFGGAGGSQTEVSSGKSTPVFGSSASTNSSFNFSKQSTTGPPAPKMSSTLFSGGSNLFGSANTTMKAAELTGSNSAQTNIQPTFNFGASTPMTSTEAPNFLFEASTATNTNSQSSNQPSESGPFQSTVKRPGDQSQTHGSALGNSNGSSSMPDAPIARREIKRATRRINKKPS